VEPRAKVELATCRLRNERLSSISFVFNLRHSPRFAAFRYLSPVHLCNALCDGFACFSASKRETGLCMKGLSTREAAEKLGVTLLTLQRHVSAETVDAPPLQKIGGVSVRL